MLVFFFSTGPAVSEHAPPLFTHKATMLASARHRLAYPLAAAGRRLLMHDSRFGSPPPPVSPDITAPGDVPKPGSQAHDINLFVNEVGGEACRGGGIGPAWPANFFCRLHAGVEGRRQHAFYSRPLNPSPQALDELDYPARLKKLLLTPHREIHAELVVTRDSGEIAAFSAFRVQHDNSRGPFKGGFRLDPAASMDEVRALASLMTWKTAVSWLKKRGVKRERKKCCPDTAVPHTLFPTSHPRSWTSPLAAPRAASSSTPTPCPTASWSG